MKIYKDKWNYNNNYEFDTDVAFKDLPSLCVCRYLWFTIYFATKITNLLLASENVCFQQWGYDTVSDVVESKVHFPTKFWRLTGWTNIAPSFKLQALSLRRIAFRICMACYRRRSTVSPGKFFLSKNNPSEQPFWGDKNALFWVWEELEAKLFTTGHMPHLIIRAY